MATRTEWLKRTATVGGALFALSGLIVLFGVPITERDSFGDELRCGTVAKRDDTAANEYRMKLAARSFLPTLGDLGIKSAEGGEASSKADRPAGEPTARPLRPVDSSNEDLLAACDEKRSSFRLLSIVLIAVGLLAAIGGVLGARLAALGKGARLPSWMRECPEYVQAGLVTTSGVTGAFTGLASGGWRLVWILATLAVFLLAVLISVARYYQGEYTKKELAKLRHDHQAETQQLLGNELHSLAQLTAEAISIEDGDERRGLAQAARSALISAAAHIVGASTMTTRANLFRLSEDGTEMRLERGGFAGRGARSSRVFKAGDSTFDLALVEQGRFVKSAKDELVGAERAVPYQTFLTYPVSIGRDRIHGVLTVDSLTTGDLDEARDMPIMALLSALIAMTYECEKF